MKDNFKLLLKYVMRFVLKIYWIIPIKKKNIFFMSNMGKGYLCNPKYIYQSMVTDHRFKDWKFIWCFIEPEKQPKIEFSTNTKLIRKGNYLKYFYYLLTSEVIIYNCGGFSYAPIRPKQFLIETGHGGGLQKKNGFMVKGKSTSSNKGIAIASKDIKLWLASDEMHGKVYIRKAMAYKGEILKSGYPRSDIFFVDSDKQKKEIRNRLGIANDVHIILYAPTFKGSESNASTFTEGVELIDVNLVKAAIKKHFGGNWLFATRGHLYSQSVPLAGIDADWTSYSDMQELLLISDILITDYSSCVWDFFVQKKPAFLFVPDREYYEGKDRGFYIPLEKWPATIVNTNNEWNGIISQFNEKEYEAKLNAYGKMMNSYENGTACEAVKERVLKQIKKVR